MNPKPTRNTVLLSLIGCLLACTDAVSAPLPLVHRWIDVVVAVDQRVAPNQAAAEQLARDRIASTNAALYDSGIPIVVELAGVHLAADFVGYQSPPPQPPTVCPPDQLSTNPLCRDYNTPAYALDALYLSSDGLVDGVHTLRTQTGADIVMYVGTFTTPQTCGVAKLGQTASTAFAVAAASGCGERIFEHELAHLLGADHEVGNPFLTTTIPYAHAFGRVVSGKLGDSTGYRTILASNTIQCGSAPCPQLGVYSNPRILDMFNLPMGNAASADNARIMSERAPFVATYRSPPAATGSIPMNPGMNGSWYEPVTSGQGISIEVSPTVGSVSGGWYTYNQFAPVGQSGETDQRWYSMAGNYTNGATSVTMTIYRNTGGLLAKPPSTSAVAVGTATLKFQSCTRGTLDYTLNGISNRIHVQRLNADVYCQTYASGGTVAPISFAAQGIHIGLGGSWYTPAFSGQGVAVEVVPGSNLLTVGWYTYMDGTTPVAGPEGQRWYTASGTYTPGSTTLMDKPLMRNLGGRFDAPPTTGSTQVGHFSIQFHSCSTATVFFRLHPSPGQPATPWRSFPVERLIPNSLCTN